MLRRLPFFKLLALAQVLVLARSHLQGLTAAERRRLGALVKRGHRLDASERRELRKLVGRLEPRAFAVGAADRFSPLPLPKRLLGGSRRAG